MADIHYKFGFVLAVEVSAQTGKSIHLGDLDCEATACISLDEIARVTRGECGGWYVEEYRVRGIESISYPNGKPAVTYGEVQIAPNSGCWIAQAIDREWKQNRVTHESEIERMLREMYDDSGTEADYRHDDRVSGDLAR